MNVIHRDMPEDDSRGEVTRLLNQVRMGNAMAEEQLFGVVYAELHRIASRFMRSERPNHTLQPTALVHEAYLRILGPEAPEWQDRAHFLAVAAQAMRRILVDHSRARRAGKRGGDAIRVELIDNLGIGGRNGEDVIAVDSALTKLEAWDARQCRVVELRFFAGMTEEETALILGVSTRTVKRDWNTAKVWLLMEMTRS